MHYTTADLCYFNLHPFIITLLAHMTQYHKSSVCYTINHCCFIWSFIHKQQGRWEDLSDSIGMKLVSTFSITTGTTHLTFMS
jgi:hypothetical protein